MASLQSSKNQGGKLVAELACCGSRQIRMSDTMSKQGSDQEAVCAEQLLFSTARIECHTATSRVI
eukprot:6175488-Pleurochrysis_carterae.AAC.1